MFAAEKAAGFDTGDLAEFLSDCLSGPAAAVATPVIAVMMLVTLWGSLGRY